MRLVSYGQMRSNHVLFNRPGYFNLNLSVAVSVRVQVRQQFWANLQRHESSQQNQTLLRSDVCGEFKEINESI